MKDYNLTMNYDIRYFQKCTKLKAHYRSDELQLLQSHVPGLESLLFKEIAQAENNDKVSNIIAEVTARRREQTVEGKVVN
jgi:hypothetical protein